MLLGRTRFIFLALAVAFAAAGETIASAPQSLFPDISLARVEIFADAGDLPPEAVRSAVGVPLETALATLPGLRATRTYADPGKLELELDFDPHGDPDADLRAVRAALDDVRDRLPVTHFTTLIEAPEAEPVVTYGIVSAGTGQAELARRTEAALAHTFVGTPDLGRLTVFAGPRVAYDVRLDPKRLAANSLTARDVANGIAAAYEPRVAGALVRGEERLTVTSGAVSTDAAALGSLAVAGSAGRLVPLRTLGRASLGTEDTGRQASFDALHGVLLNAYLVRHGDAVALADGIAARLPELQAALPADARITLGWDQTRPIRDSQRALRIEMLLGALIALTAVAIFLRDGSLVAVAAVVLPLALAFTLALLVRCGLRLDLMTLGGLAIAIGLIVDEVIVVVEAIRRALDAKPSAPAHTTIALAVRRIARPLVASTAANAVVFAPLGFLGGVPGFFFRALAITLVVALAVSIALSLWIVPLLARTLGARARSHDAPESGRLERLYVAYIRATSRRRTILAGIGLAVAALSIGMLARTPADFLPQINEGQFEIKYALPPGMSLDAADAVATNIEREVLFFSDVAHVARLSGVDTDGNLATPPDAGTIRVTLKDSARGEPFEKTAEGVRVAVRNVDPSTAVEVHQLLEDQINDLSGAPEPVQLVVSGPAQDELDKIASELADRVSNVRGVTDVFDGVTYTARTIHAAPLDGRAPNAAFADELRARIGGIDAGSVMAADGPIPVVVRIDGGAGLGKIARLAAPKLATSIREENGTRIVRVTGELEDRDLSAVTDDVAHRIAPILAKLPAGYHVAVGGAVAAQRAAFAEFATILVVALVLVFGVLVAAFDSFRLPLVVLAAVPLTPIGVALALRFTNTPLNVASFMGMLLLVGIVVRSGILLVDSANRRVREGATPSDAMERAATERLRPILMTTLATLGALAPIALGIGAGAEMERPLAIAVIGGIVTSTALTLAIVPALYVSVVSRHIGLRASETTG